MSVDSKHKYPKYTTGMLVSLKTKPSRFFKEYLVHGEVLGYLTNDHNPVIILAVPKNTGETWDCREHLCVDLLKRLQFDSWKVFECNVTFFKFGH